MSVHVGVIMDGNGRWAQRRGRDRIVGHRAGARALRRTVEAAPGLGISTLSVYAFSADNWSRPADEVSWLMRLFGRYLRLERGSCVANGVRVSVIGRRDRLAPELVTEIETTEGLTRGGDRLHLRVAVDYSAREIIRRAADSPRSAGGAFEDAMARAMHAEPAPPVDLLIRTGGEQRLSDFLLWECAYAELWFSEVMWPDFGPDDLACALADFGRRDRRFGGLPAPTARRGAA